MRTFVPLLAACILWSARANAQQLSAAEYFIDSDPGPGQGTSFPITTGNTVSTTLNVDASTLPVGFHTLSVRLKDNTGVWGLAPGRLFYIYGTNGGGNTPASPIAAAEYFIDTDPGVGNGTPVSVPGGNTSSSGFTVDASALTVGFHTLSFRYKDADGRWSLAPGRLFYIYGTNGGGNTPAAPIAAAEYFIDTDPGVGNGTAVSVPGGNTSASGFTVDASALAVGFHTLSFRYKDADGRWSHAPGRLFYIYGTNGGGNTPAAPIASAEYFIGADPGVGNGIPLSTGTPQDVIDITTLIDASTLAPGSYTLSVRLKDTQGHWGLAQSRPFIVLPEGALANDECLGPAVLTLHDAGECPGLATAGTTDGATSSDISACTGLEYNDVWYSVNSGTSPTIQIDLSGVGAVDLRVDVMDACGGNTLHCFNNFPVTFSATPTTTYLLRVYATSTDDSFSICASGATEDCEGVPGGPNGPGAPCDDGQVNTVGDVYQSDCSCSGYDCAGILGGNAGPGSPCAVSTTIGGTPFNGVYDANCTCTWMDCEGVPNGSAYPGNVCEDNNPQTPNSYWSSTCTCTDYYDCAGAVNGPLVYGAACDDGDPLTSGDKVQLNCTCAGLSTGCADSDVLFTSGDGWTNGLYPLPLDPPYYGATYASLNGISVPLMWGQQHPTTIISRSFTWSASSGGRIWVSAVADDDLVITVNGTEVYAETDCAAGPGVNDLEITDELSDGSNTVAVSLTDCQSAAGVAILVYSTGCINDCQGVPDGPAQPGTPCDDGLSTTGNDTWSLACVCEGELIDCLGVIGGDDLPGTACDDADACTNNDLWNASCACAGTFEDPDNDGICTANDNCPNLFGQIGDACDDGNPNTTGDVNLPTCVCAGMLVNDCLDVPGGPAQPGTACNDNDACTTNDVWDVSCTCAGTFQDTDGDGICNANDNCPSLFGQQGDPCDDLNANTVDDTITPACVCAGELPEDCEGVVGGPAQPGTPCDDGNASTINDQWDISCVCAGTPCEAPVPGSITSNSPICSGSELTLSINPGGTSPFTYAWTGTGTFAPDNSAQSVTVTGAATGTYGVLVSNGCGSAPASTSVSVLPGPVGTLSFTGVGNFADAVLYPLTGEPSSTYTAEVIYTESGNAQLPLGYPRLILDYEGDGVFNGALDRTVLMTATDVSDLTTNDGKRYRCTVLGLPAGTAYRTHVQIANAGCTAGIGPFDYPDVLVAPDLEIFANDISFSEPNPEVGSSLTVYATVRNNADYAAADFNVRLIDQFEPGTVYPDIDVPWIAPHDSITVSWDIITPSTEAWCPMQVRVDVGNAIVETNELNNTAIRPFVNGEYNVPGGINVYASVVPDPSLIDLYSSETVTISGFAYYTGTAVPLQDSSVAGATVTLQGHLGETYTVLTNSQGFFTADVLAVDVPGPYTITGQVTDYTLTGAVSASYERILGICPAGFSVGVTIDQTMVVFGQTVNAILAGQSISGAITVTNSTCEDVTIPTLLDIGQDGGIPELGDVVVPPLAAGATFTLPYSGIQFSTPGYYSLCATSDADYATGNVDYHRTHCAGLTVFPALPDIVPNGSGGIGNVFQCQVGEPSFAVWNIGAVPTGLFDCRVDAYRDGNFEESFTVNVSNIDPFSAIGFSVPYVPPAIGSYTFELECDVPLPNGSVAELDETNNTASYAGSTTACQADLYISYPCELPVAPVDPQFPGSVTYNAVVGNGGNAVAEGPIEVSFEVSTGGVYSVQYAGDLAPGQSVPVSVNAPSVAPATAQLTALVDPGNTVPEFSEGGNATDELCHEYYPTICYGWGWPLSPVLGQTTPVSVVLASAHLYTGSLVKVRFEVSGPDITGTALLGDVLVDPAPGRCYCGTGVTLPGSFLFSSEGTYTFTFTVDPDGDYAECDEGNNVLVREVVITNLPDLRVLSQYINPSLLNPDVNEPVTFDITYENIGYGNLGSTFDLRVMADNDELAVVPDVPGLVTGGTNTVAVPVPFSSDLVGVHVIRAIIDANNEVLEGDELNNEATRAIVVGAAANLYFAAFGASDTDPQAGEVITISASIANNGDLPISGDVQFFHVTGTLDTVLITTLPVSVNNGASVPLQFLWTTQAGATGLIGRIVNASGLEFTYADNQAVLPFGTACPDIDSDGVCDGADNCPGTANVGQADTDGDGTGDACDPCDNTTDGSPCDDGDACTTGETYLNCACQGGTAGPDTDADGICDANDNCPSLPGVQGDPCDDLDPNTVNDVIGSTCVCAGALPNDACGDAVVLTLHDAGECPAMAMAGTLAGATAADATGCGGLPYNDVWYTVNSGSATQVQLYLTGDGPTGLRVEVLDACGGNNIACLNSFPSILTTTPNTDYWFRVMNIVTEGAISICVSLVEEDCEGVVGGPALPGTPCDDGDACTTSDLWDAACLCAGTYADTDDDGTCDANDGCPTDPEKIAVGACGCGVPDTDTDLDGLADCLDNCPMVPGQIGSPCDVGNPCTGGGFIDATCICQSTLLDTDGDGIPNCSDSCPAVPGQQGSPCDDGDANTINDTLNSSCICEGQTCPQYVGITFTTDANGPQTSYDIVTVGTTAAVCSGGGLASNTTVLASCCLPDGCYELRVFDSAGDGIVPGGYVLRDPQGRRIIDNAGDGVFGTVSQVAANLGFCIPLSTNTVITAHCDRENWTHADVIQAQVDPQVTAQFGPNNYTSGYQFWFFDPDGGYSRRVLQTHANPGTVLTAPASVRASYLRLNAMVTSPLPFNTLLNVRVRAQVAGVYKAFGPACRFRIPTPACLTTQLTTTNDPIISCGANVLKPGGVIYATGVTGATNYRFTFTRPGYNRVVASTTRSVTIGNWATAPLQCGLTYDVRVQVSYDGGGTYCPYGNTCSITVVCGAQNAGREALVEDVASGLLLYPNPNRDGMVTLRMEGLDVTDATPVGIAVFDPLGSLVLSERSVAADGLMNHRLLLSDDIGSGLYLVRVTVNGEHFTARLLKE